VPRRSDGRALDHHDLRSHSLRQRAVGRTGHELIDAPEGWPQREFMTVTSGLLGLRHDRLQTFR
jgi:hypothetical protein